MPKFADKAVIAEIRNYSRLRCSYLEDTYAFKSSRVLAKNAFSLISIGSIYAEIYCKVTPTWLVFD